MGPHDKHSPSQQSDEEIIFISNETDKNREDIEFDNLVGFLESILVDDSFSQLQSGFCRKHCGA